MIAKIRSDLKQHANKEQAKFLSGYFKTGPGEYGEGDKFLGIRVPVLRKIAKKYLNLDKSTLKQLFLSDYHEERALCVIILVNQYNKTKQSSQQKQIYNFYIKHKKYVNNWDLVDISSPHIVGPYLYDRDREILYRWIKSKDIWTRRIAIMATFYFIRNNDLQDTLNLSELLLQDNHDLIHKAVGWMLREVGKKDLKTLEAFLQKNYQTMPRTMLRYAIEKLSQDKRLKYLQK